uniref:Uncharacterized protein n=1 Tax=Schlesneria paludicola TaxID=360056 RepID=A0A7C4LMZ9_9PLAN
MKHVGGAPDRPLRRSLLPCGLLLCGAALAWGVVAEANEPRRFQWPWMPLEWMPLESWAVRWPVPPTLPPLSEQRAGPMPARPLRRLELVTGEQFYVEWLRADPFGLEVRWRGHRVRLCWDVVAELSNLPGVVDVLDESFEDAQGTSSADAHSGGKAWRGTRLAPPWRWLPAEPVAVGQVQWCQRADLGQARGFTAQFAFSPADGSDAQASDVPNTEVLQVGVSSEGWLMAVPPPGWSIDFRQPLRLSPTWDLLSLDWDRDRWRVLCHEIVVATGRKPEREWTGVSFDASETAAPVWIDDVRVQLRHEAPARAATGEAAVTLARGDVLYGRVATLDPRGVHVHGARGSVHVPWREWVAVHPASDARAVGSSQFVHGVLQRVQTPPPPWPRGLSAETWIAAALPTWGEPPGWAHPMWGRLHVEETAVRHSERWHRGDFCWLLMGLVHLGDEVRPSFLHPEPQGSRVEGEFVLHAVPRGTCVMSIDVAELEPSGPDTPPTQPFLSRLRGGSLRTELFVNGRLVGDWNRGLSWRPPVMQRQRLRMAVPVEWLQTGRNTWEIRQQPLAPGDHRLDDCELGRLALELAP